MLDAQRSAWKAPGEHTMVEKLVVFGSQLDRKRVKRVELATCQGTIDAAQQLRANPVAKQLRADLIA